MCLTLLLMTSTSSFPFSAPVPPLPKVSGLFCYSSRTFSKEDIKRALEAASESDAESTSSSTSSSSMSSFAKNKPEQKNEKDVKKPKGKAKSSAKKAKVEPSDKQPVKQTSEKQPAKVAKEISKLEAALQTHQKSYDLLAEVTPDSIWRSVVRTAELERRMGKASTTMVELKQLITDSKFEQLAGEKQDQAKKLDAEFAELLDWIAAMKESSRIIRTTEPLALSKDISETGQLSTQLAKCSDVLVKNVSTLSDMVHQIAKKLSDVPWLDSYLGRLPQIIVKSFLVNLSPKSQGKIFEANKGMY